MPSDDVDTVYLQLADIAEGKYETPFGKRQREACMGIAAVQANIREGIVAHEKGCRGRPVARGEVKVAGFLALHGYSHPEIADTLGIETERASYLVRLFRAENA